MGAVKITAADKAFSDCVRERANWCCERCGAQCPPDKRMGLHCSHFHGRGKWSVRFDPDNAEALCFGCHQHLGANPHTHAQRALERLGAYRYTALQEKAQDTTRGGQAKREQREIAAHYRAELWMMRDKRAAGRSGRIEFTGYL